jgi:hypothetical protein
MIFKTKTQPASSTSTASASSTRIRYSDIEEFRRAQSRKLWAAIAFMGGTNIVAVAVVAIVAIRPVPVIAFDSHGKAMVFKDTSTGSLQTDEVRVRQFTREFLDRFVGVDATRLQEDLKVALNMMTPLTRELVIKEGAQVERRKKYEGTDVRSSFPELEIRVEDFDPAAMDKDIHLFAWGRQEFSQIYGASPPVSQWIFIKAILERQVVRELTPYGLLVKYIEYSSYTDKDKMEAEMLRFTKE